jgi:2,4-dienoyl-CoA reductase-like NADH-dependent reductase (Old Yellow Enzyme family)
MSSGRFPHLLSPLDHGRLQLRNRVMMSGHMTLYSTGGMVGPRLIRYYAERAAGGVAIIVTEAAAVHPTTVKFPEMMRPYENAIVPWLDALGDAVHEHGAKIVVQLAHGGSRMSAIDSDLPLMAPSAVISTMYNEMPRAMTVGEIAMIQEGYVRSAANVARSRADGVEIHAGHGYLPVQFLSPMHNQRTDAYGGSLENRARFLIETLKAVRGALGDDKILGLKLNGEDGVAGGLTVEDYEAVAALVAETRTVDYINVTVGVSRTNHRVVPAMPVEQGVNVANAARIKNSAGDLPVFAVGRIYQPGYAENVIAEGSVDGVAIARALIADPNWVNKAATDPSRIRPCIAVNQGCFGYLYRSRPITCLVNPRSGKEGTWVLRPAEGGKRVAVVGGGPAGCEAAIAAAERGHDVTLFESSSRLGGLLNHAASVESRRNWEDFLIFQKSELSALGVDVRLGTTVDAEVIASDGFDHAILAIGAAPAKPSDAELHSPQVVDQVAALDLWQLDGRRAVIVDEVETMEAYVPAEHLARQGAKVTVVTAKLAPGGKLDQPSIVLLMQRFAELGIDLVCSARVDGLETDGVRLGDVWSGRATSLPCDVLVYARDRLAPERTLAASLERAGRVSLREVGDCLAPRSALEAVREGRLAGEAV